MDTVNKREKVHILFIITELVFIQICPLIERLFFKINIVLFSFITETNILIFGTEKLLFLSVSCVHIAYYI